MNVLAVKTGIVEFDKVTGGFSKGGSYVISGAAGTGKSVFAAQFMRQGLSSEEKVILVTEQNPKTYLDNIKKLEMPFESYVNNNELIILRQTTQSIAVVSDVNEFATLMTDLANLTLPYDASRIVFDSVIPIVQLFSDNYLEEGIASFLYELSNLGLTVLLTSRMPSTRKAVAIRSMIEERMNGSFHFDEHTKENGEISRKLVVRKMLGLTSPYPVFSFAITPGIGIEVLEQSETGLQVPKQKESKIKEVPASSFSFTDTYRSEQLRREVTVPKYEADKPKPKPPVAFTPIVNDNTNPAKKEANNKINFTESGKDKLTETGNAKPVLFTPLVTADSKPEKNEDTKEIKGKLNFKETDKEKPVNPESANPKPKKISFTDNLT